MTPVPGTSHLAPPQAVIFDLGKVLLDFDYTIAARTLAPHSDLPATEFKRVVDQSPLLHRYESGQITTAEFAAAVRRLTGFRGSDELFHGSFGDIFAEIPEMVALQRRLAEKGVPTYVFSNTNELAIGHIRRQFPFFGGFTGYIYSYEVRSMKPDPGIYEALERLTGFRGTDLLYLDDRAENIAHGAERGWRTVLHNDHAPSVRAVSEAFGW